MRDDDRELDPGRGGTINPECRGNCGKMVTAEMPGTAVLVRRVLGVVHGRGVACVRTVMQLRGIQIGARWPRVRVGTLEGKRWHRNRLDRQPQRHGEEHESCEAVGHD